MADWLWLAVWWLVSQLRYEHSLPHGIDALPWQPLSDANDLSGFGLKMAFAGAILTAAFIYVMDNARKIFGCEGQR